MVMEGQTGRLNWWWWCSFVYIIGTIGCVVVLLKVRAFGVQERRVTF